MRRVILESPFAGNDEAETTANIEYARACVADCLRRGEAALASHLLYTQPGVLRDDLVAERELGIAAGLAWVPVADATVVYADRGVSPGMLRGIAAAEAARIPVIRRSIQTSAERATVAGCRCGSGLSPRWYYDARGIELFKGCDVCAPEKLEGYRPDMLADQNYEASEDIDPA